MEQKIEESRRFRSENADRLSKLQIIESLNVEESGLDKTLTLQQDVDPDFIEGLRKQIVTNKLSVNRWTDNVFQTKSYLVKKKGMAGKEVYMS